MPNHVTNVINLEGDRKQIRKLLEEIKNDDLGIGTVDFNKIIPMPDNIYRGNLGTEELKIYGKNNWYDWCIANWGTKWNSYNYEGFPHQSDYKEIRFHTAWAAPHPVMEKLSEMYPDIEITHEWADEDIGMNCGRRSYEGGERTEEYYPESEKERIDFALRVMDIEAAEFGLYLNAAETEYINLSEDEFELIEVDGQTALFTNERLTDKDIPKELHRYHLRESDDGSRFISIEKNVAVNHGGTVLCAKPIDLGEQGYITFDDESSPNFVGANCTMEEYMNGDFEQSQEIDMTQA